MRVVGFVFASLACSSHARRVQTLKGKLGEDASVEPLLKDQHASDGIEADLDGKPHAARYFRRYEHDSDGTVAQKSSKQLEAIEKLKRQFLRVLREEPNWDKFDEDFVLIDQTKWTETRLADGLNATQTLWKVLPAMRKRFKVRHLQYQFIERRVLESEWRNGRLKGIRQELHDPSVVVRWKLELVKRRSIFRRKVAAEIEAETVVRINADGKVDRMEISDWLVNGKRIRWPSMASPADSLDAIGDWIGDMKRLQDLDPSSRASIFPSTRTFRPSKVVKAMKKWKVVIPRIFRRAPNWKLFANDMKISDLTGASSKGLGRCKMLLQLLHAVGRRYVIKDLQVRFSEVSYLGSFGLKRVSSWRSTEPHEPYIMSQWKVLLKRKRPFLNFWRKRKTVGFEAEALFHFNDENKVDDVYVDRIRINGKQLGSDNRWPDIIGSDTPSSYLDKLYETVQDTWTD